MNLQEFKRLKNDKRVLDIVGSKTDEIYEASVNCCSKEMKCMIIMEELAELQQAVSKFARGELLDIDILLEEVADVYTCLGMLNILTGTSGDEIMASIAAKLYREGVRRGVIKECEI